MEFQAELRGCGGVYQRLKGIAARSWVGQIVYNFVTNLRRNSVVALSDDLRATRQLAEATADLS